jgi:hypothetical protein
MGAATSGAFGASLHQSIVSLTGYGPDLFGARTSADLRVDFFGGLQGRGRVAAVLSTRLHRLN